MKNVFFLFRKENRFDILMYECNISWFFDWIYIILLLYSICIDILFVDSCYLNDLFGKNFWKNKSND
jgi:hypothetical protein